MYTLIKIDQCSASIMLNKDNIMISNDAVKRTTVMVLEFMFFS